MFYSAGPRCQLCENLFTISYATIGIFTEYVDQDYTNSGENYTAKSFKEPIFLGSMQNVFVVFEKICSHHF